MDKITEDTLLGTVHLGTMCEVERIPFSSLREVIAEMIEQRILHWVKGENRLVTLPRNRDGELIH